LIGLSPSQFGRFAEDNGGLSAVRVLGIKYDLIVCQTGDARTSKTLPYFQCMLKFRVVARVAMTLPQLLVQIVSDKGLISLDRPCVQVSH
jgi:hypothetical protein